MVLRNKLIDADQGYLFSFLGGLFMQHMAHSLCPYYTTYHPLNVDFIGFSALLYNKIRGFCLGLCRQSETGLEEAVSETNRLQQLESARKEQAALEGKSDEVRISKKMFRVG